MGLIKANSVSSTVSLFSMKDIEGQAKAVLLRAREQADRLLAQAQVEAQALREQAKAEGLVAGRQEGLQRGREEGLKAGTEQAYNEQKGQLAQLVSALGKACAEIDASRRELAAAAVRDVVELAIAIAERVTKRQGVLDRSVVEANVAEALKLVVHTSDVRIAIHPGQKSTLAEALPRLRLKWPALGHVELIEDASLLPGGCRIHTAQGVVDGDLDEQLRRVVADLLPEAVEAA